MSACCCTGPTTGDHLCPCQRRDEDARQAAQRQETGVFSQWNACCYRDECRQRATDYAALQAKLGAVTKDALAKLQQAADSLRPPERLTELRAEYWKAGAVAAIEAMNAALTGVAIGDSHE